MAKVGRGEWAPPARPRAGRRRRPSRSKRRSGCSASSSSRRPERRSKTIRDLEWRLSVVMDVFGPVGSTVSGIRTPRTRRPPRAGATRDRARRRAPAAAPADANAPTHRARVSRCGGAACRTPRFVGRSTSPSGSCATPSGAASSPAMCRISRRPRRDPSGPGAPTSSRRRSSRYCGRPTLIEDERRGLTWEKVARIRASRASARRAGEGVRRLGHPHRQGPARRALGRPPRRATATTCRAGSIVETLILAGPRVSELCGLRAHTSTSPRGASAFRARPPRPTRASGWCRCCRCCAST